MIGEKAKGGMVIELGWTIIFAMLLILLIALNADWYYILGAIVFFIWCLKGFIREIKDKDVEKSIEDRKRIEKEITRDSEE